MLAALVATLVLGEAWATKAALFGVFPLFALSLAAMFAVLGLVVRADYVERKAAQAPGEPTAPRGSGAASAP
jgi:hypothetical protein